jgi:hypothetical protein
MVENRQRVKDFIRQNGLEKDYFHRKMQVRKLQRPFTTEMTCLPFINQLYNDPILLSLKALDSVLESLWSNLPVITSMLRLPEVGGQAVYYVNPQSAEK